MKKFTSIILPQICTSCYLLFFAASTVEAQKYTERLDSIDKYQNEQNLQLSQNNLNASSNWVVGSRYVFNHRGIAGSPFYNYYTEIAGNVYFNGNLYSSQAFIYDTHIDELIIRTVKSNGNVEFVKLNKSWVDKFDLYSKTDTFNFVHISSETELPKGYYELHMLKKETFLFLEKHQSVKQSISSGAVIHDQFEKRSLLYILDNGNVFKLKNAKAIAKKYPEKKGLIREIIKKNRLNKELNEVELIKKILQNCM